MPFIISSKPRSDNQVAKILVLQTNAAADEALQALRPLFGEFEIGGLWSTPTDMARATDDDTWRIRGIWAYPRDMSANNSDVKVLYKCPC